MITKLIQIFLMVYSFILISCISIGQYLRTEYFAGYSVQYKHLVGDVVATTLNSLTSVGRSGGTKAAEPVTVPRIYPAIKYVVFLAPPVNQCRQYLVEVL